MNHVGAGELHDVARMIPVLKDAGDDGQEHLPGAIGRAREVGRPAGEVGAAVGFGQIELRHADEAPVRAGIGRFGDADGRAVNPGDAGQSRHVGPAIGVIHPPFFHERVPDNGWIRRAVIHGVAIKGLEAICPVVLQPDTAKTIKPRIKSQRADFMWGAIQIASSTIKSQKTGARPSSGVAS